MWSKKVDKFLFKKVVNMGHWEPRAPEGATTRLPNQKIQKITETTYFYPFLYVRLRLSSWLYCRFRIWKFIPMEIILIKMNMISGFFIFCAICFFLAMFAKIWQLSLNFINYTWVGAGGPRYDQALFR